VALCHIPGSQIPEWERKDPENSLIEIIVSCERNRDGRKKLKKSGSGPCLGHLL
jgi:hypothetical protein